MKRYFYSLFVSMASFMGLSLTAASGEGEQSVQEFIMHHVSDSNIWHPLPLDFSVHFPEALGNGLHGLMLLFAFIILTVVFGVIYKKSATTAPRGITNLLETLVLFIRDKVSIEYLGEEDGRKFAPFFLTIFFMILVLNLMGLVPIFASATGNVNVTAALAMVTLSCMVIGGVGRHGIGGFLKIFVPPGLPVVLVPFIFFLEFLGLFIKPFALTIRLFANLFAGHIVVFSIIGVIITFGVVGLPIIGLALFIYLLEIFVAFLQAYIFTLLSAIFIGEMLHPAH